MSDNKDRVWVEIIASERVHYNQIVSMKRSEFERIDALLLADDRKADEATMDYVDRSDIIDDDDWELSEFRIVEQP